MYDLVAPYIHQCYSTVAPYFSKCYFAMTPYVMKAIQFIVASWKQFKVVFINAMKICLKCMKE